MNNQFNRSFDFPLKQFWCRSFKDSSSCGIHLKVFALFFLQQRQPPVPVRGRKRVTVWCSSSLAAWWLWPWWSPSLEDCATSVAHTSRSTPNCPVSFLTDWLNEWKFMFLQCWLWLYQLHASADLLQIVFPEWMIIYTWGIEHYTQNLACSCSVGCVYVSHTNQQISSILSSEFGPHVLVLVVVMSITHISRSPYCPVNFLNEWKFISGA